MFGASIQEVKKLEEEIRELKDQVKAARFDLSHAQEKAELDKERALNSLRKEMQESLIKSDLMRVEALAKLEIYEKTDTKADANTIKEMISKLIGVMGKQEINVIK